MIPELDRSARQIKGPVPFWFINGPITREDVARELDEMYSKGIREVIVHPRYGLDVHYLSEQWFDIFGWCVDEAAKRGMFVWIYDELNWPSGTAGMTVQELDPAYMGKYLNVQVKASSDIDLLVFEPGQFLVAARVQGGVVTKTRVLDTIDTIGHLESNWRIFNCRIGRDRFYIDTLSREAVDCFKRLTYDEYYKRYEPEFGKTIRAVFTDEPSIYWVTVGYDDMNLPYTERLFPEFERRYGYSAVPNIPYLYYPGKPASEFRAHFWRLVADLFNTNYHGNLAKWCHEHGVIYTGHNNHEEPLRYQIRYQGNMFGAMQTMDIPGVDHLDKVTLGNHFISIIGLKIASSAAHLAGKSRVMTESFGCMSWNATYTDMKKVVDWQYSLGINLLVPHALFHTVAGKMKRESPPSFFIQSPLWPDFGCFSDYVDRLSEMLTDGKHVAKALVYYPLSGLFSAYQTDRKTQEFEHMDNFLSSLCLELMKNHLDYELVDPDTLNRAEIDAGEIKIGQESYTVLIIPATAYLQPEEYQVLEKLAGAGANTYFFYRAADGADVNKPESSSGINFEPSENMVGFVSRLRQSAADEVRLYGPEAEDIAVLRREKEGRQITFLVNRTEKPRTITVEYSGNGNLVLMQPEDGTTKDLVLSDKRTVPLTLQPYQSVFLTAELDRKPREEEPAGEPRDIPIVGLEVKPVRNVASLYRFTYSDEGAKRQIDVRESPAFIPVNWDPNPPDFGRFAGEYTAFLELDAEPAGLELVVDRDYETYGIYINGEEIVPQSGGNWLVDPMDLAANVSGLLKTGRNEIKVLADSKLSEPIRFAGYFDVSIKEDIVRLVPPGSLREPFRLEKGLLCYSGTISYRASFSLDGQPKKAVLDLGDVCNAAAVWVNCEEAGRRLWAPYEIDITRLVKTGQNDLDIEVRNSMANLMLGDPRPLGLRKTPVVRVWR